MKSISKIIVFFVLVAMISFAAPVASAQIVCPNFPLCDFNGIHGLFKPVCLNGALVRVFTPLPITLLYPYVPITPIVPVYKLWGPIPASTTAGKFLFGGVCEILVKTPTGKKIITIPVFGTLIQIGTTLGPTPFIPTQIFK